MQVWGNVRRIDSLSIGLANAAECVLQRNACKILQDYMSYCGHALQQSVLPLLQQKSAAHHQT